mmetsp:Transcript_13399/g.41451  ORF Transcript_13399/g.41451 Transcript_13399/m.41451 type:complete len:228 (-) Transcript_13399:1835-2518(-)
MGGPPKAMKSASLDAVKEKSRQASEDDPDAAKIFWDMVLVVPTKALKANDKSKKKEPELFDATYVAKKLVGAGLEHLSPRGYFSGALRHRRGRDVDNFVGDEARRLPAAATRTFSGDRAAGTARSSRSRATRSTSAWARRWRVCENRRTSRISRSNWTRRGRAARRRPASRSTRSRPSRFPTRPPTATASPSTSRGSTYTASTKRTRTSCACTSRTRTASRSTRCNA